MRALLQMLESETGGTVSLYVGLVLDDPAEASRLAAAEAVAKEIKGFSIDREHKAHVTLLFAKVDRSKAGEATKLISQALKASDTPSVFMAGMGFFPPGRDGVPVYMRVAKDTSYGVVGLADRLLRSVAHLVKEPVREEYHPHVTLGYAKSTLMADEYFRAAGARAVSNFPPYLNPVGYEVTVNGDKVATLSIDGVSDGKDARNGSAPTAPFLAF